jgi:hypothetical protein
LLRSILRITRQAFRVGRQTQPWQWPAIFERGPGWTSFGPPTNLIVGGKWWARRLKFRQKVLYTPPTWNPLLGRSRWVPANYTGWIIVPYRSGTGGYVAQWYQNGWMINTPFIFK